MSGRIDTKSADAIRAAVDRVVRERNAAQAELQKLRAKQPKVEAVAYNPCSGVVHLSDGTTVHAERWFSGARR